MSFDPGPPRPELGVIILWAFAVVLAVLLALLIVRIA